jgi:capsular exopolysaccharide synthesis family protein
MGKFFKALEQAERERSLREDALRRARSAETVSTAPEPEAVAVAPAPPIPAPPVAVSPVVTAPVAAPSKFQRPPAPRRAPAPAPQEVAPHEPAAPSFMPKIEEHLVSLLTPTSFGSEQYRALRHRVEELHRSTNVSVVAVSSPAAGDGKTITAINLAGALAQSPEARVLIIDADLRRPSMSEYLGLEDTRTRGLVGAIADSRLSLKDVVEACPPFNLSVVQAGKRPSSPYELLKSPRLGQLLEEARQQYDYVVLDTPPLVPMPDCSVVDKVVDGFLVVVAAHRTNRRLVKEALSVLDPTRILGLVFNVDDTKRATYADYGRSAARRRTPVDDEVQ